MIEEVGRFGIRLCHDTVHHPTLVNMDDFRRITHVPAVAVNYPVGHGGTYRQPHGGEFRIPAVAWLDWQLKGDRQAAKMFIGKNCGLVQRKGWTIERNKKMKANL